MNVQRLAERARTLRREAGLTRDQLAVRAGVSSSTVDNLEQGRFAPKLETVDRVSRALGVPLSTFFSDDAARLQPAA